jgi:retron-type reverse transcriptase
MAVLMSPLHLFSLIFKQFSVQGVNFEYYKPQFSPCSHGFRPKRGCHTALHEIQKWDGSIWFIEGDIKGCFDNIDHAILLSILKENIHDNRFLRLIEHLLKVGYLEEWQYNKTLSGTPQGGIISPLLSNSPPYTCFLLNGDMELNRNR